MNTEDLLVAILHRVGSTTRLGNDVRLAKLFHAASQKAPDVMSDFAWHPQYHDSKALRSALQVLDLGGGIVRENASIRHFRVAPRVSGDYGRSKFEALSDHQREVVDGLANEIRNTFSASVASV
jgi:hypothetical protein